MSRFEAITDEQWKLLEAFIPFNEGRKEQPFTNSQLIVNWIIYR